MKHISASQLLTFEMCGEIYRRRYIEREDAPRNLNMLRGTSVHRARHHALRKRLAEDALPNLEETADVTASIADDEYAGGEIVLPEGVTPKGLRDDLKDSSIRLALCDRTELLPGIIPEAVERKTVVEIDGLPPIVAYSDVDDTSNAVHELKTGGPRSTFPKGSADKSEQLTVYCLCLARAKGLRVVPARLEKVRDLKTGPRAGAQPTFRGMDDFQAILNRFATMLRCIEAGLFMPASNQFSWKCSPGQCEYWETCPYVTNPVSVGAIKGGGNDGGNCTGG